MKKMKIPTNNKKCLITGEPLTEHSIKLNCGHEFNYIPLFKM